MEGNPTYLTLKEASARLGVHPNTLRNWEQRGLVRLARLPGSRYRRVPESEVERLASKLETGLPDFSSDRWVRSGKVLVLLPPPDDPELRALAEAMAEEVQAELAKVEPQGTLEETMRAVRGYPDWLEWGESPRATKTQPTHGASWSVRIEPPDTDPEAIAAGQALAREVQEMLAQSEPEQTLEEVMQSLRGWSWS